MRTSSLSSSSSSSSKTKTSAEKTRIVVSFRIDKQLWLDFDKFVTDSHGNYKKSPLLESLIRKYINTEIEKLKEIGSRLSSL